MSKTTTLFNSKFPSNDVRLKLNFYPSQIIFLGTKNIGKLMGLYLKWRWSFSPDFLDKVLLGLASLYHIQMKSPKTVYLAEQCQLMSHRNSVHSIRMRNENFKTSCPWYRNLTVYSVMHLKMKHVLTASLSFYRLNAIQIHKCKFLCPKCPFKGKLLIRKCWFIPIYTPLFVFVNVISLLFDRISWNLLQIMRKWFFLTMISKITVHM